MRALGIEKIADKFPVQVSGGQKQRCACARAVVTQPQLICADGADRGVGFQICADAFGYI